jgi:hypothetical protein
LPEALRVHDRATAGQPVLHRIVSSRTLLATIAVIWLPTMCGGPILPPDALGRRARRRAAEIAPPAPAAGSTEPSRGTTTCRRPQPERGHDRHAGRRARPPAPTSRSPSRSRRPTPKPASATAPTGAHRPRLHRRVARLRGQDLRKAATVGSAGRGRLGLCGAPRGSTAPSAGTVRAVTQRSTPAWQRPIRRWPEPRRSRYASRSRFSATAAVQSIQTSSSSSGVPIARSLGAARGHERLPAAAAPRGHRWSVPRRELRVPALPEGGG